VSESVYYIAGNGMNVWDNKSLFRDLPRLSASSQYFEGVSCKICGAESHPFDRVDFNKYCSEEDCYRFGFSGIQIPYFRCISCGFLFADAFDGWSHDDFAKFIYNDDYVKVDPEYVAIRPNRIAETMAMRLRGAEAARILDYGSGAGIFVARMRELGFLDIHAYDPFASPSLPPGRFDIITCFEVMEHSVDPRKTLTDMAALLRPGGCIVISQTLQPADIHSRRGAWWYLAPRNGHISTFTEEALEILGRERGLFLYRGDTLYGFAGKEVSDYARRALNCTGPSIATVSLYAPSILEDAPIFGPTRKAVLWHRAEARDHRRFRWSGSSQLQWRVSWPAVARLRVVVRMVRQAAADYAACCSIALDDVEVPVESVRGELVAEFSVQERTGGIVELRMPQPVRVASEGSREIGLGIAIHYPPRRENGNDARVQQLEDKL